MRVKTKQVEAVCLKPSVLLDDTNLDFVWSEELAFDLLEARELIKEMRSKLLVGAMQANNDMTMFRSIPVDARIITDLIKRTKEYEE